MPAGSALTIASEGEHLAQQRVEALNPLGLLKKRCFEMLDADPVQFVMQSHNLDLSL